MLSNNLVGPPFHRGPSPPQRSRNFLSKILSSRRPASLFSIRTQKKLFMTTYVTKLACSFYNLFNFETRCETTDVDVSFLQNLKVIRGKRGFVDIAANHFERTSFLKLVNAFEFYRFRRFYDLTWFYLDLHKTQKYWKYIIFYRIGQTYINVLYFNNSLICTFQINTLNL